MDNVIKQARVQIRHKRFMLYIMYNMKWRELEIMVADFGLLGKHWFSSRREKKVIMFGLI